MTRLRALARAVGATAVSAALLIGVPTALGLLVGWPLPTRIPDPITVRTHLDTGHLPDAVIVKALALVVWVTWAQLAAAFVIETAAALAGRTARRVRLLPGVQTLAARLVTSVTMTATLWHPATVGAAPAPAPAPPPPAVTVVHDAVVMDNLAVDVPEPATTPTFATPTTPTVDVAGPRYVTVAGDTWWGMAELLFGDGARWRELRDLNLDTVQPDGTRIDADLDTVHPGWHLALPTGPLATAPAPLTDRQPGFADGVHTVEPGDNLWTITTDWLETDHPDPLTATDITPHWRTVIDLNLTAGTLPTPDPDLIHPGDLILLPTPPVSTAPVTTPTSDPQPQPELAHDDPPTTPSTTTPPTTTPPTTTLRTTTTAITVPPSSTAPPVTGAPVTTAPATTTPASPTPETASAAAPAVPPIPVLVLAGVTPVLAALALWRLRVLRRVRAARRRSGTPMPVVVDPVVEDTLRTIAAADAPDWIDATLRCLHALAEPDHRPELVAVRIDDGDLELRLRRRLATPPPGFTVDPDDARILRLAPDVTLDDLGAHRDAPPVAPALCPIGATSTGDLLLDLRTIEVLAVHGPPERIAATVTAAAFALGTAPWAEDVTVHLTEPTAHDHPPPDAAPTGHLDLDDDAAVDALIRRAHAATDDSGVDIVLAAAAHPALDRLAEAATRPGSRLAVLGPVAAAHHHLHLDPEGHGRLEPLAVDLATVAQLAPDTADRLTDALAPPPEQTLPAEPTPPAEPTEPPASPTVVLPDPDTEDSAVQAEIDAVMAPRPVEIVLLAETPAVHGVPDRLEPRVVEAVAYLAARSGETITTDQWRTALYPDGTSDSTFRTASSRVRRHLGDNADGTPRLSSAINTGLLVLSEEVGVDWARFRQLLALDHRDRPLGDRIAVLHAALGLVEGQPFASVRPGRYGWVFDSRQILSHIEVAVVDAADELARLALDAGDPALACWAADRGLRVVPEQEGLYRRKMQAADLAQCTDDLDTAFRHAQRAAQSLDPLDEVQPETQELYERLRAHRQRLPVSGANT